MDLDKLWQWERRKLPCQVREESGNPSGDDLRERFAELAGVNLQDLLSDMKTDRKKKEAKSKVYFDHDGDKRFKDMNARAHVLGASTIAIKKLVEHEKQDLSSTRNTNKRFMALPLSPPARILMDIQRERAKPLRLPVSEERNEATMKLEKKLAKQRAQRMAAKVQTDKDADSNKADQSKSKSDGSMTKVLPKYDGDMFGTGGEYMGGLLYLSRMPPKVKKGRTSGRGLLNTLGDTDANFNEKESFADEQNGEALLRNPFENTGEDEVPEISSKLYCATALCNWARNPSNANRLAKEGAVRAIIVLASEKVSKINIFCAGAFRYMSEQPVLAEKMIDEKCISVISDMITTSSDDFISGNLAICLLNLTRVSGKEGQLVEDSVVLCFMNLISQHQDLHSACCRGLYNLTCIDASYPMMERVIRALITLSSSGTANIKHLCAAALCNLADLKAIRLRMVEEGVVQVLGTLARGAETRTRRVCAVILQNLTATKICRTEMVSRNCVQVAYGLSSDQDPIILRCIGLALSRLALEPGNSSRVITDGGIMALCNIAVKYPTIPGISQPAAVAFQLLSSRPAVRLMIVQEGSVAAIASLLRLSGDVFTLQHGLLALCNILSSPENHLAIVQQGLVTTLTVLGAHESDLLKDFCALAYFNLSCAEDSRKHIVNAGAITSIISLCVHDSQITKRRCAATLCNISSYEVGMNRMVADGIIPALVKLLVADDIETVRYGCAALCRLCSTVENGQLILESGAVTNVVQGAIEGDLVTKQFCCAVLSSLTYYESCRERLCESDIITALKHLSEMTDDTTRQRCLVAYANLSCADSVQDLMVEQGVVSIIAQLADSYQEINQNCCAKALCNLSRHEETRMRVVEEGGVQALMMISMVRSVDLNTKLLCVKALSNLLDLSTMSELISHGIVGAMSNLCSLEFTPITDSCAQVLNQLSMCHEGRMNMVEKHSGMHALFGMFDKCSDSTKILVARTTANLVLNEGVRARAIEHGALDVLSKGINLDDADASLHCAMAALSAALEPSFRMACAKSSLSSSMANVVLQSSDPAKTLFCLKALAILAWNEESRVNMQTPVFANMVLKFIDKISNEVELVWIAQILFYICVDYSDYPELLEVGMQHALHKLVEASDPTIMQCVAGTIRCFCSDPYSVNILASPATIEILMRVVEKESQFGVKAATSVTMYNISCIIYAFAAHSPESKARIATPELIPLIDAISANLDTMELVASSLCLFCADAKCRNVFATDAISKLVVKMLELNPRVAVLSNVVHAIYSLSKIPASRQQLLDVDADRILFKLSQSEDAKLKANCSRSLKNLSSDASETIEEGAVAALIAMSLEGKAGNKNTEEVEPPDIMQLDARKYGDLKAKAIGRGQAKSSGDGDAFMNAQYDEMEEEQEDSVDKNISRDPWLVRVVLSKGDNAGRGPAPPLPPKMSSESSVDHPSTVDDLDNNETEASRTKMAFAKMQTPYELRDSYGFDDKDFEVREDELMSDRDRHLQSESISDEDESYSQNSKLTAESSEEFFPSQKSEHDEYSDYNSNMTLETDSMNAANVYEINKKRSGKDKKDAGAAGGKKKKKKKKVKINDQGARPVSSSQSQEKVASLGLY